MATHLTNFNALVDMVEHYGGNVADDSALVKYEMQRANIRAPTSQQKSAFKEAAKDCTLALAFV